MKHWSAFVIFTCIQVVARRRHVNARDRQDYFILQGLKDFGMRQTCPKNFWKNLRLSVERDPFRMPLALTLQRKNQKAFCVERSYKLNDYGTKVHRIRILLRNNKRSRQVDKLCNLCCHHRMGWLLLSWWNRGRQIPIFKASRKVDVLVATKMNISSIGVHSLMRVWNGWEKADMNTCHFGGEQKPITPQTITGTVEQATKITA